MRYIETAGGGLELPQLPPFLKRLFSFNVRSVSPACLSEKGFGFIIGNSEIVVRKTGSEAEIMEIKSGNSAFNATSLLS